MKPRGPDMTGQRFGRLLVVSRMPSDGNGNARWLCRCDCGWTTSPLAQSLRSGATVSCGCFAAEHCGGQSRTHGASGTQAYKAWHAMVQRCTNPNNHKWPRYGGRGIKVCERWMSYENFLEDMGPRPAGMTIDRKDNDGNYEPANCRWATQMEQGNNRGNNRWLDVSGARLTLSQAAREAGIDKSTLRGRLRAGWPVERALAEAINSTRST